MKTSPRVRARLPVAALAALLSAGCASFSPDGGFDRVAELSRERVGQTPAWQRTPAQATAAQARAAELLREPLDAERAVAVALLAHRGLQARYAELGIAEADRVGAGRLPNPTFAFGRLAGGGALEIDRSVLFDVLRLLTLPAAQRAQSQAFERVQLQAALDTVEVAVEARRAFFGAVAAQELFGYAEQVQDAAAASGELAERMRAAGNFSELARLREQSFRSDATAQLARARHALVAARERLARALGVADAGVAQLPERLPALPDAPLGAQRAEQTAIDRRLDVRMARRAVESTADALGLTRATRYVDVLHAGWQNQSARGEPRREGVAVEFELPLFDFGSARTARAEAKYMQSLERAAQVAIDARSQAREAWSAYRTAWDLARHWRDDVVPLRQRIAEENLLRYNAMLVSVFDLLADARDQVAGVTGAVETLRDFWLADADLQLALAARAPDGAALSRSALPRSASAAH